MRRVTSLLAIILGMSIMSQAADIYVDWTLPSNITDGSYSIANRNGTGSDGDAVTTITAGVALLCAGDNLYVRGGNYFEQVTLSSVQGTSENWITIAGYQDEVPVVSGTEALTDWTQSASDESYLTVNGVTNSNYASIYWSRVPESYFNAQMEKNYIFEDGERLFVCSWPEQSEPFGESPDEFNDIDAASDGQDTYLIDTDLDQADNYWNGAILRIHLYQYNNNTVRTEVNDFTQSTSRIDFEDTLPAVITVNETREDHYRLLNHPMLVDDAGEYYITEVEDFEGSDYRRVYLFPNDTDNLTADIRMPVRNHAFYGSTTNDMYLTIERFEIYGTAAYGVHVTGTSGDHAGNVEVNEVNAVDTVSTGILLYYTDDAEVQNSSAHRNGNRGIMTITGVNNRIHHCTVSGTYSTNISFYNAIDSSIANSSLYGARGGHGNGISTYGNVAGPWCNGVLVAGNHMYNCNISQNYCSNYCCFGNLFDMEDSDDEGSGITAWQSSYSGYFVVAHNTAPSTLRTAYLIVDEGTYGDDPCHYIANNIFDGMSWDWQYAGAEDWRIPADADTATVVMCEYNGFTRYEWTQAASRGWYGNTGDVDLTGESLDDIFVNPTYETGDWQPKEGGPIDGNGTYIYDTLESLGITTLHSTYDFTKDLYGTSWDNPPAIGAIAGAGSGAAIAITSDSGGSTTAADTAENQRGGVVNSDETVLFEIKLQFLRGF